MAQPPEESPSHRVHWTPTIKSSSWTAMTVPFRPRSTLRTGISSRRAYSLINQERIPRIYIALINITIPITIILFTITNEPSQSVFLPADTDSSENDMGSVVRPQPTFPHSPQNVVSLIEEQTKG
ncbi:hypothetical protein HD806DRAFT_532174 [Xylariaceae sp. AK1471]|nr:hypothetical protein HD806DRAFT_532174 [Xylariaceae sp. AK1471]